MKKHTMIFLLICLTMLYVAQLWCIDISVSSMILTQCSGDKIVVSGIYFENVEPRITYHLALMFLSTIWLIVNSILVWKIIREKND